MTWQLLAFAVGVAVTATPDVLSLSGLVADAFHVLGPIAAALAGMAASSVLRALRRLHLVVGTAIALAPFALGGSAVGVIVGLLAGAVLVALAFPGSVDMDRYGGGWRAILSPP